MRRFATVLVLVGLASGAAGCVTPSIPIPPPDASMMTFGVTTDPSSGAITSASLEYPPTDIYRGGLVYVFNRSVGHGIIELVNADGSIGPTTPVEATSGHSLVITVENDDQTVSTCITLRDDATAGNYCP
jgi:hypothetical protein